MNADYTNHPVFEQLARLAEFYERLALLVFNYIPLGVLSVANIDSYVYSSIQGTLDSIKEVLFRGRINDSYALLRKYYDGVIINTYSILFLDDHFSVDNFVVSQINNWLKGKEKLPEFRIMSNYIRSSVKLKMMNQLLYKDTTYKEIRDRCNDYTHYNFYRNVIVNDNQLLLQDRKKLLDEFSNDVENIFILHFVYLFSLNEHYLMDSYYIDCLDIGETPEIGSQYYVAPFIQEIFTDVVTKKRNDIAIVMKSETSMRLE